MAQTDKKEEEVHKEIMAIVVKEAWEAQVVILGALMLFHKTPPQGRVGIQGQWDHGVNMGSMVVMVQLKDLTHHLIQRKKPGLIFQVNTNR